jgi:hypothetical protein
LTINSNAASALRSSIFSSAMIGKNVGDRWNERWSSGRLASNGVSLGKLVGVVLVESINIGGLELASWDLLCE